MNKSEFLNKLTNSLNGKISYSEVQERIEFYNDYIDEEVSKGKNEEEVLEELGDPRLIAKSILDSLGYADMPYENTYESNNNQDTYNSGSENNSNDLDKRFYKVKVLKWYEKLIIAALIVALIIVLLSIVSTIIFTFGPIIILIILFIYLFKK